MRRCFERNGFPSEFYAVPVLNDFFRAKIRRYAGPLGETTLRFVNPDRLPMPFRTNFFVTARRLH